MAQTAAIIRQAQNGIRIDYTPAGAVTAGDVVLVGSMVLVATETLEASRLSSLAGPGHVVDLPKTNVAIPAGNTVCWSASGTPVTGDASSGAASHATGTRAGVCTSAAAAGDSYVRTLLAYTIS